MDCLKNAPNILHEKLATSFRIYHTHGHVNKILILSTLIPLIKEKLGDHCTSKNYRSISLSSVILRLFDWVIIILCRDKFAFDVFQFNYKPDCSTNICTWMVIETINYFYRNGSEVFTYVMDRTKAFDNVLQSKLSGKVID